MTWLRWPRGRSLPTTCRRVGRQDPAAVEENEVVDDPLGFPHAMGHEQPARAVVGQAADGVPQEAPARGVDVVGGLVDTTKRPGPRPDLRAALPPLHRSLARGASPSLVELDDQASTAREERVLPMCAASDCPPRAGEGDAITSFGTGPRARSAPPHRTPSAEVPSRRPRSSAACRQP